MPLLILTVVVVAMSLVTVWNSTMGGSGGYSNKRVFYKCSECGEVAEYTREELKEIQKKRTEQGQGQYPGAGSMGMSPMNLDCPKCNNQTLRSAVQCPECDEVFLFDQGPDGDIDYTCPKCGQDWLELIKKPRKKK